MAGEPFAVDRVLINNSFIFNLLRYCAVNGLRKDESRPSSLTIYLRSARLPLASGAAATCGALPGRKWLLALMREADKAFAWFLSISRSSAWKLALRHGKQGYIGAVMAPIMAVIRPGEGQRQAVTLTDQQRDKRERARGRGAKSI